MSENRVAHTRKPTVGLDILNSGFDIGTRVVEMLNNGQVVDTVETDIPAGEVGSVSLSEPARGESEIDTVREYTLDAGNRLVSTDIQVVGLWEVDTAAETIPTHDIGRIEWSQTGTLELNQGDTVNLHGMK